MYIRTYVCIQEFPKEHTLDHILGCVNYAHTCAHSNESQTTTLCIFQHLGNYSDLWAQGVPFNLIPHQTKQYTDRVAIQIDDKENTNYVLQRRLPGDVYSETSLIQHSMEPENNVGLGGCWIMECLLPYLSMVTVPHIMVGLERMLDYRGVRLERFHCTNYFKEDYQVICM